jgi:DNA-binding winged helix-turn-helix (wHTH) protein
MSLEVLVFEGLEIDRAARRIVREGEPVSLQPKMFELLCALVDRRQRVVTKDELLELVWTNEHVVPEVLTTAIRGLRSALGDTARDQRILRTVRNVGYQFVARTAEHVPGVSAGARARHESFIGRQRELELFDLMTSAESSKRVLFVHGPGGIGKTSMLQELAYRCAQQGRALVQLNAEQVIARPAPFESALAEALGTTDLYRTLAEGPELVLSIDNFDLLVGLGSWFLDTFVPRMPDQVRVVLASRTMPRPRWTADPAWQALVTDVLLGPFDDRESRHFLAARGISLADTDAILRFTKGIPLALAVAAAAVERGAHPSELPEHRDVIDVLVDAFSDRVPSIRHRHALEIASLLSSFNEALLAGLLDSEDVVDLYTWLSGLPFVRPVSAGLQVHALVRDALLAHLRWRNPERLGTLAARCYALHFPLLEQARDSVERITLTNRIMSLGRHHPALRPFYTYDDLPEVTIELASASDAAEPLVGVIARHEGDVSAAIFRRWLELRICDLWLARDGEDVPAGIALTMTLPVARLGELSWDPAIDAIRRYLEVTGGTQPEDHVALYRYLVARDTYQAVSPVMQRCHEILNYDLHTLAPNVSHSFHVYGETDIWEPVCAFAEFGRLDGFDFELEGRRFGIFGHSWRAMPLQAWANAIARKLASGTRELAP